MATTACELILLCQLFSDLTVSHTLPINLHCDDQATMHIAKNPIYHEYTKHIEIDSHLVHNCIQQSLLVSQLIPRIS